MLTVFSSSAKLGGCPNRADDSCYRSNNLFFAHWHSPPQRPLREFESPFADCPEEPVFPCVGRSSLTTCLLSGVSEYVYLF